MCYHSVNVIKYHRSYLQDMTVDTYTQLIGYCYHSDDVISLSLSQSDHIKQLALLSS
jgi:hypothetical protein